MGLAYQNLDAETRAYMIEEIERDVANNTMYLSSFLSPSGLNDWPDLLQQAAKVANDDWLADQLRKNGRLNTEYQRRKAKSIEMISAKVPITAPETMSEGEFNHYYTRAVCRRAEALGVEVIVYRAKAVANPRPESEQKIGHRFDPVRVLEDLRSTQGVEPALGLPPGPNSGLTVRLP